MTANRTDHLLDLQAQLQDDPSGQRRAQLLVRLKTLQGECVAAQRQPADRAAYERLQAAGTAVSAAIRIIEKFKQLPSPRN